MHQNYYFLRQLAVALRPRLVGGSVQEAFSQEKDELVLLFETPVSDDLFCLKASLTNRFSCLSFPLRFERARKNSVNLFESVYGLRITDVHVFQNERAFGLFFADGRCLVFKLFGNRSNILLFDGAGSAIALFNNKLGADRDLKLSSLDRTIVQDWDAFCVEDGNYSRLFPTLGKLASAELSKRLGNGKSLAERWEITSTFIRELEDAGRFYLARPNGVPVLSLFPVAEEEEVFSDPIQCLNAFYIAYIREEALVNERSDALRWLHKRIVQTESYLSHSYQRLDSLATGGLEQIANILMANLHVVSEGADEVELFDFYNNEMTRIRLRSHLSPQKNAEVFYRKAKNEKREIAQLEENIQAREEELIRLRNHSERVSEVQSVRELRSYLKENAITLKPEIQQKTGTDLFKVEEFMGYSILIGRNAKNNDLLTLKYANKDDLWLHARDVSGSHVVVKSQPGKKTPGPVIERAAELAAWNSKRRNESLCPVIVTFKKFVRKGKGMPDGAVIVEKEDVVMVVPKG